MNFIACDKKQQITPFFSHFEESNSCGLGDIFYTQFRPGKALFSTLIQQRTWTQDTWLFIPHNTQTMYKRHVQKAEKFSKTFIQNGSEEEEKIRE